MQSSNFIEISIIVSFIGASHQSCCSKQEMYGGKVKSYTVASGRCSRVGLGIDEAVILMTSNLSHRPFPSREADPMLVIGTQKHGCRLIF